MKTLKKGNVILKQLVYTLRDDGVSIRERSIGGISEDRIRYDKVGWEGIYISQRSPIAFCGAAVFALVAFLTWFDESAEEAVTIFWSGLAVAAILYYRIRKVEGVKYVSDYGYLFIQGNKVKIQEFQRDLEIQKMAFIEATLDSRLEVTQLSEVERYLISLKEGSVLKDSEYHLLRNRFGLRLDSPEGQKPWAWLN